MSRYQGIVVLVVSAAFAVACQKEASINLPEPVGEAPTRTDAQPTGASLPPNHPPINPSGASTDVATDRPLPAGTRNPMEDVIAFKARLDKNPKDIEALVSLGNANMMISRFEPAQEMYVRALAVNPKDLNVRTNLAIAYKYGGKPDQAFAELRKNLEIDPTSDSTLYNLGFLYLYDKQDQKNAIATWKKWLALYPNAPAAADVSNQVAQIEAEMRQGTGTGRAGS